jgi:flotillin
MSMMSIIVGGILVIGVVMVLFFLAACYKRVNKTGEALIITKFGNQEKQATLNGAFVWPLVNQFERMDITRKSILIVREGVKGKVGEEYEGLHCKDNIRANVKVCFYLGVNPEAKDIIQVANNFTAEGASSISTLSTHFAPKFSEALKTAIKSFNFEELYTSRIAFRDAVKGLLSNDMESFKLYDVVIDKIEQTPLEAHDPLNVLDSDGIRKISEITAEKNIQTTEIREKEKTEITKKHVDGEQARLQLERSLVETQEKTNREKEHIRIDESTKIAIRTEEARSETETVRIKIDQDIQINEETSKREVEVTKINNDKIVEIQREQVTRAKEVEKVQTEREVVEKNMDKEKFVESQRKEIAVIVAERTSTEKEIATQEELTKDIHTKSESERHKLVVVQKAEASSQAIAIEKTTIAKADLESTKSLVEKDSLLADNRLIVATKDAEGKQKLAEAHRVEKAAEGLALADVESRNVEVDLMRAEVTEKQGYADAIKVRELGLAQALSSEANYKAMGSIDNETRAHEISKLEIEKDKEVRLAQVGADTVIATKNAEVMAAAMQEANIEVIGGGEVFDQIRNSLVSSKALDKKFESSELLQKLFGSYVNGTRDFASDLKEVLEKSEVSTGDLGNMALVQGISQLLKNNPNGLEQLQKFLSGKDK